MARGETHICTACGYEGKPVKPPSDEYKEGSADFSKAIARVGNLIFPGLGLIIKPLALFVSLPIYIVLWVFKPLYDPKKHCSNCGLPTMVKLSSDAGYVAKKKQELRDGQLRYDPHAPKPETSFGREVKLPGDELKNVAAPVPRPERLPSLEVLLQEAPENDTPPAPDEVPQTEENKPKRPVDPDQF